MCLLHVCDINNIISQFEHITCLQFILLLHFRLFEDENETVFTEEDFSVYRLVILVYK